MTHERPRTFWGDRKPPQNRAAMFRATPRNAATQKVTGSTATIRIYGPIDSWGGFWGVSAKDVASVLDDLDDSVDTIQVRLNSPGGEAFEGVAIMNLLRAHSARTVAVVDGLAASAASIIATGCDELVMSPGTELMIHNPITIAIGDADEMDKAGRMLESLSNTLASVYAAKGGGELADWRALMTAETWYTADEAVTAGLADRADTVPDSGPTETAGADDPEPVVEEGGVEDAFDLSIFTYAGRTKAPAPANMHGSPSPTPAAASAGGQPKERSGIVAFSDDSTATLRQRLGLAENADEGTILAALEEALNERAEPQTTTQLPEGVVAIDSAQLNDLREKAEKGVQALARQDKENRERIVQNAVATGRIAPARKDAWLAKLEADPAEAETLNSLQPGLVPVTEIGNSDGHNNDNTDVVFTDADAEALAKMAGTSKEALLHD